MKRIVETRMLPHSIDDVFDFVADFSRTPEWDPGVLDSRRVDGEPLGAGARFDVLVWFGWQRVPMEYRIVEYRRPEGLVLEGRSRTNRARDDIRFESVTPTRTRITWTLELWFEGTTRLVEPLSGPFVRRLGRAALDGLVARAELPLHPLTASRGP